MIQIGSIRQLQTAAEKYNGDHGEAAGARGKRDEVLRNERSAGGEPERQRADNMNAADLNWKPTAIVAALVGAGSLLAFARGAPDYSSSPLQFANEAPAYWSIALLRAAGTACAAALVASATITGRWVDGRTLRGSDWFCFLVWLPHFMRFVTPFTTDHEEPAILLFSCAWEFPLFLGMLIRYLMLRRLDAGVYLCVLGLMASGLEFAWGRFQVPYI